jgi:hypothetical protein
MNLTENLLSPENKRDWRITTITCRATYKENNFEIFVILEDNTQEYICKIVQNTGYKSSGGKVLYGTCGEGDL